MRVRVHKRMRACISVCARGVVVCVFGPAEAAGMIKVGGVVGPGRGRGVFAAGIGEVGAWSWAESWACSQLA